MDFFLKDNAIDWVMGCLGGLRNREKGACLELPITTRFPPNTTVVIGYGILGELKKLFYDLLDR